MRILPVVFALAANAASQSTWIVDDTPGPGVHFTSLPAAVAAAAIGDTLLVGPGSYRPFQVSGKALSIRGAGNAVTKIDQPSLVLSSDYVAINAVPVGRVFRLSGVSILQVHQQRLMLRGNGPSTGAVVLDGVISRPWSTVWTSTQDGPGLQVQNLLVHAHRCVFLGGTTAAIPAGWFGHVGVVAAANAILVANDCSMRGGDGAGLSPTTNIPSGSGLFVFDATCRLSGCTLRGGDISGSPGLATRGHGLAALGTADITVAGTAADVIAGGTGGTPYVGGLAIECSPPSIVRVHGPVTITGLVGPTSGSSTVSATVGLPPLPRLSFAGTTLGNGALQASQPITLSLDTAPPGQLFVLLADLYPGASALPGLSTEPLLVSGMAAIASLGLLDPSGVHTLTVVPATQLPYVVGLSTHWQGFVWDPALGRWLGSNAALLRVQL